MDVRDVPDDADHADRDSLRPLPPELPTYGITFGPQGSCQCLPYDDDRLFRIPLAGVEQMT
jgi:hypothetical protein